MLLGTMHGANQSAYTFVHAILEHICQADLYIGETNLDDMKDQHTDNLMLDQGTIIDLVSKKKFDKINRLSQKVFNINLHPYINLKPMFFVNILTQQVLTSSFSETLDTYLWNEAKKNNLTCIGLESYQEQCDLFKHLDLPWQTKQLLDIFRHITKFKTTIKKVNKLYRDQKIEALYKITKKQLGGLRKELLYKRNEIMARRIIHYLEDRTPFISVGAAHLSGYKGILRLIKQAGFQIQSVTLNQIQNN